MKDEQPAPTTRETADHAELARLAEAASKGEWWSNDDVISHQEVSREDERFIYAFTPAVCSALLSEIAALRGEVERVEADRIRTVDDRMTWTRRTLQAERQRDELRRALDYARYHVLQSPCSDKQACLDQIDQAIANQGADQ